jgi:predicted Rossmann fold nucleotide-binding protein DprA/Smf involved in DNA uptake
MDLYRAKERALIAQLIIDLIKTVHSGLLGRKGNFAGDAEMLLLSGVVLLSHASGKPKNTSEIARSLGVPRVTALRKLNDLEEMGIIERRGGKYFMLNPKKNPDGYIDKCLLLIRRAAKL